MVLLESGRQCRNADMAIPGELSMHAASWHTQVTPFASDTIQPHQNQGLAMH